MESNNWINYLAMNSIKLLGDREWDYLGRISSRLEELGWINDFRCLRKGNRWAEGRSEDKIRRRRHGLTRNLHRHHYIFRVSSLKYPSIPVPIPATALSVTIRTDSPPEEESKVSRRKRSHEWLDFCFFADSFFASVWWKI